MAANVMELSEVVDHMTRQRDSILEIAVKEDNALEHVRLTGKCVVLDVAIEKLTEKDTTDITRLYQSAMSDSIHSLDELNEKERIESLRNTNNPRAFSRGMREGHDIVIENLRLALG